MKRRRVKAHYAGRAITKIIQVEVAYLGVRCNIVKTQCIVVVEGVEAPFECKTPCAISRHHKAVIYGVLHAFRHSAPTLCKWV